MKIGFTTDTNMFDITSSRKENGKSFLSDMDYFLEYIDFLNATGSKYTMCYYMPEIVLEELYKHKIDLFKESYKSFVEKYNILEYGLLGELPSINAEVPLTEEKDKYKQKLKMLKLEYTSELMNEVVNAALAKAPPFSNANEGFKDYLIWKTLLLSKEIDECENFFFFSCDKVFRDNEKELIEEFKQYHPNVNLYIKFKQPDALRRQEALKDIIDTYKLYETDIIKFYNNDNVLKFLKKLSFKADDISYYDGTREVYLKLIEFESFESNDFKILEVKKKDDNFTILGTFKTKKYEFDECYEVKDKKNIIGDFEIILKEKNKDFICTTNEVRNVDFDMGVIDLLRGFAIKLNTNIQSEAMKKMNENMKNYMSEYIKALKPLSDFSENITRLTRGAFNISREDDCEEEQNKENTENEN